MIETRISLATIGGSQREHGIGSSGVIHEERRLRTDVMLLVLVQRVGRPGTFRLVLIRSEPSQTPFQFRILGQNPSLLKNKGDQPGRVSVAVCFLGRSIRAL